MEVGLLWLAQVLHPPGPCITQKDDSHFQICMQIIPVQVSESKIGPLS